MSYPYLVFVLSIISSASHFALKLDQSVHSLVWSTFSDSRNLIVLFGHWLLHAYGILAIKQTSDLHLAFMALVPLPSLFYVATARFTDPINFTIENQQ